MTDSNAEVLWLEGPGRLVMRHEALPAPGAGEIRCETVVTAISPGTELAAYKGLPPLRPSVGYPRLQGYCNIARVVALGEGVEEVAEGDRVLTFQSHRSDFTLPVEDVLYVLPEGADADQVVCAYLYHLGYNAVLTSGVRAGSRVLVIGLGVLGLTAIAMAAIAGGQIYAVSDHDIPADIAKNFGAAGVAKRGELHALSEAMASGADVVITTSNSWLDWEIALKLVAERGTIASLGFPGRGNPPGDFNPLDSQYFYMKQLTLKAVGLSPEARDSRGFLRFNERDNLSYIAGLIEGGHLDTAPLVSGRYPAAKVDRAYRDLIERRDSPLTYLLDWRP